MNLTNFFNPQSIAIVGASSDKSKVGFALLSNLIGGSVCGADGSDGSSGTTKRNLYPISLSEKEILGLKAYSSIKDVPSDVTIDLAVIAIRADMVPQVLRECAERKVSAVTIVAAGFREMGEAGLKLEEECAAIAMGGTGASGENSRNPFALLGPNCLGTIDARADFNASFAAGKPLAGGIAFLSQSGALGTSLLDMAIAEGVGFSKFISLGNEAALTEMDFLEYLADDPDTKAILMYVEKLSDGPAFMRLARRITRGEKGRKGKPIVILKAGRSSRGLRAVMSHTGSLAPDDAVFSAACRQSGVITVTSIREFFNMAKLFQLGIFKTGAATRPLQRFIILTNGGGPSVVATDLVDLSKSLSLVELSSATQDALRKVLPPMAAFGNPVDIIGDALSKRYKDALDILTTASGGTNSGADNNADGILMLLTPQMMTEVEATAKLIVEYRNKNDNSEKPQIIPIFLGGPTVEAGLAYLRQNHIPNFSCPIDAIEALDALAMGVAKRETGKSAVPATAKNQETPETPATPKTSNMLGFSDMSKMLTEYGISLDGILVKDKNGLVEAISELETFGKIGQLKDESPTPVTVVPALSFALKAISPNIVHKSDAGAVKLNLKNLEEVEASWDAIVSDINKESAIPMSSLTSTPAPTIEGMLLQMMSVGKEVIIGMKRDAVFGPTILFGLGGIFTEVLKDTSLRIASVAPVSRESAIGMIGEIRGAGVLTGLRGEKPVNIAALADIIVNISKLAIEHPQIKEIDLNPVIATSDGAVVVDARVAE